MNSSITSSDAVSENGGVTGFVWQFVAMSAAILFAVAAFNWTVDPFGIYQEWPVEGFNRAKPVILTHARMIKALEVRRLKPAGLAMGTSRTGLGIDLEHPGWPEGSEPRYSLTLADCNTYEMFRYLQHAAAVGPVRTVLIGLDFYTFNATFSNRQDFSETRLAVAADGSWNKPDPDEFLSTLFSFDALKCSWETIAANRRPPLPGGRQRLGLRAMFLLTEDEYITDRWFPPPRGEFAFEDSAAGRATVAEFERLLRFARTKDIRLYLFISPCHARLLECLGRKGLWPAYEEWERRLVGVVEADAARHPNEPPVELWDFSGYNSVTTERVPRYGDRSAEMTNYMDSTHYTRVVGDWVQDRVFGRNTPGLLAHPDFGVRLNAANIERHLADLTKARAAYRIQQSEDAAEVAALAAMKKGDAMSRRIEDLQLRSRGE